MAADRTHSKAGKKSFVREWGLLICFGVGTLALIVGNRFWSEYQADQPVLPVYAGYLSFLAEESPKARAARDKYYAAYGRTTVASQHFIGMCKSMQKSAVAGGVILAKYSEEFARACASDPMADLILEGLPHVDALTGEVHPAKKSEH